MDEPPHDCVWYATNPVEVGVPIHAQPPSPVRFTIGATLNLDAGKVTDTGAFEPTYAAPAAIINGRIPLSPEAKSLALVISYAPLL